MGEIMSEPSGRQWCEKFPTSSFLGDLVNPFRENAGRFIQSLRNAGATVTISATYRPPERAYLMHWSCMIAKSGQDPASVPSMAGVDIDWAHGGDVPAARRAAEDMVSGYDIAFPAALVSRHTQRRAVDMTVRFQGPINVLDATGAHHQCNYQADLVPIGATFGVIKLATDPPHWSDDGH